MTQPASDSWPPPRPEQLAAYADGELDAAQRARLADWLADHPEAAADLEAQVRLSPRNRRFWQAVAPPRPDASAWDDLFARIESDLAATSEIRPARPEPADSDPPPTRKHTAAPARRLTLGLALFVTAAAAAAAVVLLLPGGFWRGPPPRSVEPGPPAVVANVATPELAPFPAAAPEKDPDSESDLALLWARGPDVEVHQLLPGDGTMPQLLAGTPGDMSVVLATPQPDEQEEEEE